MTFGKSGSLAVLNADNFKRNLLVMTRMIPIDKNDTALDEFLPAVLLRGCQKHPQYADIKRQCELLYGATLEYYYSYFGDYLMINYCADFLDDAVVGSSNTILHGVVDLMSQVWLHPIFDKNGCFLKEEVEKAQNAFCDAIRASDNDTAAYALRKAREIVCSADSNGYSVSVEDIEKITPQALTERYNYLIENDNSTFFYVGNQDPQKIACVLDKYFGDAEYVPCSNISLTPVQSLSQIVSEKQTLPVKQGKLTIGVTSGITMSDKDYYAMLVAVELFGGNSSSKLFTNVRERLGLCYYCGASYSKLKGIVYISAGIDPDDLEDVKAEIFAQIEQFKQGNVTDSEIKSAKLSLINSARQLYDRPYSMWSFCNTRLMLGLSTNVAHHIDMIQSVSYEDITRVAQTWRVSGEFFVNANGSDDIDDD